MTRHASVIGLRAEKEAEYRALHEAVWPDVLAQMARHNIRNFSIFLRHGLLFSYFEYVGNDFAADMAAIAADPATTRWWELTAPCQVPIAPAGEEDWWAPMDEIFHTD